MRENTGNPSTFTFLKWFNFFVYGTMVLFTSFFQLYLQDVGMNKLEIGVLMSIGPLVSVFANPFWGIWTGRYQNNRVVVLLMLAGTLLFSQIIFQASTYETIYTAMILFYFCQTPLFAQSNTLVLSYIDGTPLRFGSFRLFGSLGWALTAIAAGPVIQFGGVSVLPYLFAVLLGLSIVSLAAMPKLRSSIGTAPLPLRGFRLLFRNPYFLFFIFFGMLVSIPNTINNTFMSLYINDMGGSKTMIGLAVFLSSILEAGVFMLCKRYLRRKISVLVGWLALVSVLFVLRWWLMSQATLPLEVALIQILHSVTFGGFFYVGTELTMLLIPGPYRSCGQALYTLSWGGISGMIGGILGGWLFQYLGAQSMYEFCVFLSLIGALGYGGMWFIIKRDDYRPTAATHDELEEDGI
ncbi:MFS transporter, PPP family, 3-phenylpropionic acid transporter [Paenibacillus sophorae]|uniref:MFS transporter n=1 Tax=Paenibacillus sophorae TaxID=1333845 RepID=A0A1H8ICP6_9BACL|nr:MFS transporter [Paenibacillus sophorae]QWU15932.1 MFS transporter [Paenibacillus sophorae]SEN66560.1 MFS transporter, PPP family, 3-phenylpropionic acid transporter [Paenibacillus sophorae]